MCLHAQLLTVLQVTVVLLPVHGSSQKYLGLLVDARTKNNILKYWLLLCLLYKPFKNVHFIENLHKISVVIVVHAYNL